MASPFASPKGRLTDSRLISPLRILLEAVFVLLLTSYGVASSSEGFVSIDCGGNGGWDPETTLNWYGDHKYLDAADQNGNFAATNVTIPKEVWNHSFANKERLDSAMIFYPSCRRFVALDTFSYGPRASRRRLWSKFCYKFPLEHGKEADTPPNFMVRATFPGLNWFTREGKRCWGSSQIDLYEEDVRFIFFVDGGSPLLIQLDALYPKTIEVIVSPETLYSDLHVCLAPLGWSVAAISAIEVRPLQSNMKYANQHFYVMTHSRTHFGAFPNSAPIRYYVALRQSAGSYVTSGLTCEYLLLASQLAGCKTRYPVDPYDRFWSPPPNSLANLEHVRLINTSREPANLENEDYYVPEAVMKTAWESTHSSNSLVLKFNASTPVGVPLSSPYSGMKVQSYFYELASRNSSVPRFIHVDSSNNHNDSPFISVQYGKLFAETHGDLSEVNLLIRSNNSLAPPSINALELFWRLEATHRTSPNDALMHLVSNMEPAERSGLDFTGDPCIPVPYSWISCSKGSIPRVTSIFLPYIQDENSQCILRENLWTVDWRLDRLSSLSLSSHGCSKINFPTAFAGMTSLRTLTFMLKLNANESMVTYDLSIENLPSESLRVLDLRMNVLVGELNQELESLASLEVLDLSENKLKGNFNFEFHGPQALKVLDLRKNRLEGIVPDGIWTSPSLELVRLGFNNFSAVNLTSWLKAAQQAKRYNVSRVNVDLVNNSIVEVIPSSLESIDFELGETDSATRYGYIRLQDNPWCWVRKKSKFSVVRFLCDGSQPRNWSRTGYEQSISATTLISVTVASGAVAACLVCAGAYILWKLRERSNELRQIQEALAKDQVRPPFFSYYDIKRATDSFSSRSVLGKGGFGTVYKAKLPGGEVLAVKKINPTGQSTLEFLKEIVNITGIKHKNLIQLKGCCVWDKQYRMMIYEYAENRSLAEALWSPDKRFTLTWPQRLEICLGVARGLTYLHEELKPMMVHRDIKPQNILLDQHFKAKIADFGLVRPSHTKYTEVTMNVGGTRGYSPPEYLIEGLVSEKLDVYSFGVVLLETLSGRRCIEVTHTGDHKYIPTLAQTLYEEGLLLDLVDEQLRGTYDLEEAEMVLEIGLACCQLDPKQRPAMSHVVSKLQKRTVGTTLIPSENTLHHGRKLNT